MTGLIIRWLINAAALFITTYILEGVNVTGFGSALVAAAVLGIVNAFIRPILIFLTLPLNILTLGLLTFIINGLMLWMVSTVVIGFEVHGFFNAVVGSLILSLVSGLISWAVRDR